MRGDQYHPPVLDAGLELDKPEGLGGEALMEAGDGAHLHLQEDHRQLRGACFAGQGPEHAIGAAAGGFEFWGREADLTVEFERCGLIGATSSGWPLAPCWSPRLKGLVAVCGHDSGQRFRSPAGCDGAGGGSS